MYRKGVQRGCSERVNREGEQKGCTERVYREGVQKGCTERVYREGVQRGCSERVFREGGQRGCSERVYREGVQRRYIRTGIGPIHRPYQIINTDTLLHGLQHFKHSCSLICRLHQFSNIKQKSVCHLYTITKQNNCILL